LRWGECLARGHHGSKGTVGLSDERKVRTALQVAPCRIINQKQQDVLPLSSSCDVIRLVGHVFADDKPRPQNASLFVFTCVYLCLFVFISDLFRRSRAPTPRGELPSAPLLARPLVARRRRCRERRRSRAETGTFWTHKSICDDVRRSVICPEKCLCDDAEIKK